MPMPLSVHAAKQKISVTFSEEIVATDASLKVWSLKRTAQYGSKHFDEKTLTIANATLSDDKRTITLHVPDLTITDCYELKIGDSMLHGTIHQLSGH